MKTRKTLRITGWIQLVCCLILLLDLGFSAYAARHQIPVSGDSLWFEFWDFFGGLGPILWSAPVAIVCLAVNLFVFLRERKDLEQRTQIGKRWLWIPLSFLGVLAVKYLYLWLVAATILYPDHFPV